MNVAWIRGFLKPSRGGGSELGREHHPCRPPLRTRKLTWPASVLAGVEDLAARGAGHVTRRRPSSGASLAGYRRQAHGPELRVRPMRLVQPSLDRANPKTLRQLPGLVRIVPEIAIHRRPPLVESSQTQPCHTVAGEDALRPSGLRGYGLQPPPFRDAFHPLRDRPSDLELTGGHSVRDPPWRATPRRAHVAGSSAIPCRVRRLRICSQQ